MRELGELSVSSSETTPEPHVRHDSRLAVAEELAIAGLVPLSTVDWPGKLVATAFLQGCPLACPYCQNEAILDPNVPGQVSWNSVEELLAKRRGLLDGIVFTGGEALRQASVVDAARRVKESGFLVGLHTSGVYPRRLAEMMPYVTWVGLDIKALPEDYSVQTFAPSGLKAWEALSMIVERADVDATFSYEVRTTVYPGAPVTQRFEELVAQLRTVGVTSFAIQEARTEGTPVAFRADSLAWDRAAWGERFAQMCEYARSAGFDELEIRAA